MKKTIKYSIIVPFFNEEKVLKGFLDSVAKLKSRDAFELIMVDNNSTDKSCQIIEGYKGKIENLTLINETSKGIGAARKTGARISSGAFLASTDADVSLPPNWFDLFDQEFEKNSAIVGIVGVYRFHDKSALFNFFFKLGIVITDQFNKIILGTYAFRGLDFVVRREAYFAAGEFDQGISALEDLELALRVKKLGKIKYAPKISVDTSYRRFEGRFIRQLVKRLKAYFYRAILRDNKGETDWEVVR